jgi:hypothetical protein
MQPSGVAVPKAFVMLELAQSMPGQGGQSAFSYGAHFGGWRMLPIVFKIPRDFIRPDQWKKEYGLTIRSVGKKNDDPEALAKILESLKVSMPDYDNAKIVLKPKNKKVYSTFEKNSAKVLVDAVKKALNKMNKTSIATEKKAKKDAAVLKAMELFPTVAHMFRGPGGGLLDGRAEALLIAEFARRKHMGSLAQDGKGKE